MGERGMTQDWYKQILAEDKRMYEFQDLPNYSGYKFIGVDDCGNRYDCETIGSWFSGAPEDVRMIGWISL